MIGYPLSVNADRHLHGLGQLKSRQPENLKPVKESPPGSHTPEPEDIFQGAPEFHRERLRLLARCQVCAMIDQPRRYC
jgi:hypothetical protein